MPSSPSPSTLISRLKAEGLLPRKSLGQHFLTDPNLLAKIVEAAELPPHATVIEVGPGPGTLTAALAPVVGRLIAVELDPRLAAWLADLYADWPQVTIVRGDALALSPRALLEQTGGVTPYVVLGNIPYYITSPLIRHFLEADFPPQRMVYTVQLEVARRIVARPPEMSLLAVAVQVDAHPTIVRKIPPGAFTPPPKVHSAVLRMDRRDVSLVPPSLRPTFFRVARAGFGQKRKTLRNSLAAGLGVSKAQAEAWLRAAGLAPNRRAQTLSLEEWVALARAVHQAGGPAVGGR